MKLFLVGVIIFLLFIVFSLSAFRIFAISQSTQNTRQLDFSLDNDLTILPQNQGTTIQIASVSLQTSGFIVIKNNNDVTKIIGQSNILPPGTTANIQIEVHHIISSNDSLTAELHLDNGNKIFDDEISDKLLKNTKGDVRRFFYVK
jgi:hypothetical protein